MSHFILSSLPGIDSITSVTAYAVPCDAPPLLMRGCNGNDRERRPLTENPAQGEWEGGGFGLSHGAAEEGLDFAQLGGGSEAAMSGQPTECPESRLRMHGAWY